MTNDPMAGEAPATTSLLRHILACNNTVLPGGLLPFVVGGHRVGWVAPALTPVLAASGARRDDATMHLDSASALPALGRHLADSGHCLWRDEAFDVRNDGGAVLGQVDRGALPLLGVSAEGVHLNGLVRRPDGLHMWLGRRAADKPLDPGKLDHIVAGGIPAGLSAAQTLAKEAAEEAGLSVDLLRGATQTATIRYVMARPEGLRRDVLHCYDVVLPEDFAPVPVDGEVAGFELWPLARVVSVMRDTDAFKFNVNLALIDLALRYGLVAAPEATRLRMALDATAGPAVAVQPAARDASIGMSRVSTAG